MCGHGTDERRAVETVGHVMKRCGSQQNSSRPVWSIATTGGTG
jgi:hypothetical protein